jgi:hypothetical protein
MELHIDASHGFLDAKAPWKKFLMYREIAAWQSGLTLLIALFVSLSLRNRYSYDQLSFAGQATI